MKFGFNTPRENGINKSNGNYYERYTRADCSEHVDWFVDNPDFSSSVALDTNRHTVYGQLQLWEVCYAQSPGKCILYSKLE